MNLVRGCAQSYGCADWGFDFSFFAYKAVRRWCAGSEGPGACGHPPSPATVEVNLKQRRRLRRDRLLRSGPSQLGMLRICARICGLVGCAPGKVNLRLARIQSSGLYRKLDPPVDPLLNLLINSLLNVFSA